MLRARARIAPLVAGVRGLSRGARVAAGHSCASHTRRRRLEILTIGACATTAIRLGFNEHADPFVALRGELLRDWVRMWQAPEMQQQRRAVERAWTKLYANMQVPNRAGGERGDPSVRRSAR